MILEWKKQQEENGPPMEERLVEDELDQILQPYRVIDRGELNRSHYYRVIARDEDTPRR